MGNHRHEVASAHPGLLEVLELFSRLEAHSLTGCDGDFDAGFGVPADAPLPISDLKYAETSKLDALALTKSVLHRREDGLHGKSRGHPRQIGPVGDNIHEVCFYHGRKRRECSNGSWGCQ